MATDLMNQDVSLPFGKHLAANDKKTRDKAVRALKTYLSTGPELSQLDLLKLWKGLFYCFWMSDKPLIQQALADTLGSLVHELPIDKAIPFLGAFWEIHVKEWFGLDRLRLDKFYLLFRRVMFHSFLFLANQEWSEESVNAYTSMLLEGPLHPTDRSKPDSIRYHLIDNYAQELEKVVKLQIEQGEEANVPMEAIARPLTVSATKNPVSVVKQKAKAALEQLEDAFAEPPEEGDSDAMDSADD